LTCDLHVSYRHDTDDDPPVLHQKDALVTPDYPLYQKFAAEPPGRLGLLMTSVPSPSSRMAQMLGRTLCHTQGHRVVWRKDADPYRLKLLRSALRARQASSHNAYESQDSSQSASEVKSAEVI